MRGAGGECAHFGIVRALAPRARRQRLLQKEPLAAAMTSRTGGLHEAVSRTARFRPDAVALVSGDTHLTYSELDRMANAWAAQLASAGVERDHVVPILMPRSTDLVAALLAVLKTGAAYALLDPAWPHRQLSNALDPLNAPVLITGPDVVAPSSLRTWIPHRDPAVATGFTPVAVDGTDPCCVFFTSGTTGRPKAVLTPHQATSRLFALDSFARFDASTVMPLVSPMPWDGFSLELWAPLLSGGTSVVVDEPYLSPQALRALREAPVPITTAWLTSSVFNLVVDEDLDAFVGLEQVITGGERMSVPHVARFLARHPTIDVFNAYGPVECTVFVTTHRVTPADCENAAGIPLGRPVPRTRILILDGARPCRPARWVRSVSPAMAWPWPTSVTRTRPRPGSPTWTSTVRPCGCTAPATWDCSMARASFTLAVGPTGR